MTVPSLRVCTFRGVAAFPLQVALAHGLFEREGLVVELAFTRSSDELVEGLLDGTYSIVQASPDNFVAWRDRTGVPIVTWYGGSSGPICLLLRPEVPTIEALRGKTIAVDYPNTGWAPILLGVLARHGIAADEIKQEATGATAQVFAALIEGRTPAAMLNEPWATRATAAGCRVAADHRAVAPGLQTSAGASLRDWLDANSSIACSFLQGVLMATAWILDPANGAAATAELAAFLPAEPAEAARLFARLTDPETGWPPTAAPDKRGIHAVRALRGTGAEETGVADAAYLTDLIHRRVLDGTSHKRPS